MIFCKFLTQLTRQAVGSSSSCRWQLEAAKQGSSTTSLNLSPQQSFDQRPAMTASPLYARLSQELGLKPKAAKPSFIGAEMCSQPLLRLDHGAALLDYVNSRLSEHSDCASSSGSSSNQDAAGQAGTAALQCTMPRAAAPLLKAVSVPVQLMSVGGQWQVRFTLFDT